MKFLLAALLSLMLWWSGGPSFASASTWWVPSDGSVQGASPAEISCPLTRGSLRLTGDTLTETLPDHGSVPDPGAPPISGRAYLIGVPKDTGHCVLALSNGTVYRLSRGAWILSMQMLPNLPSISPVRITGLAALPARSAAIYCATWGDGMLVTVDGGITWYRASDGLPDDIASLRPDLSRTAFIATADGSTYIHTLQAFPNPYSQPVNHPLTFWAASFGSALLGALLAGGVLALFSRRSRNADAEKQSGYTRS